MKTKKNIFFVIGIMLMFLFTTNVFAYYITEEDPGTYNPKDVKNISNSYEITKYKKFLNITTYGKKNGERINLSYDETDPQSWFPSWTSSKTDGYGNFEKIVLPKNVGVTGNLDLSGFTKLKYLYIKNNNITKLTMTNASNIQEVYASDNNLSKIKITKSKKLKRLTSSGNKLTYIKYNYTSKNKSAVVKAYKGGNVSVSYTKKGRKNYHKMTAKAKPGYKFEGWYRKGKLVSTKKTINKKLASSFIYIAKFNKRTYISVSISKQKLWFYKNGKLIVSSDIVTGQVGKHKTPKGTFHILYKDTNATLKGRDYESFVYYWMPLSKGGIGLHDATWRSKFGGTIYKYDGSHGCINLPYKVAKKIYKNVSVGTKVKIS